MTRIRHDWMLLLAGSLIVAALCACHRDDSKFLKSINGVWKTTDALGNEEHVLFRPDRVVFHYGTRAAHECPYQVVSHHEKKATIEIRLRCPKRTGTSEDVRYAIRFSDDGSSFVLLLEQRPVGIFKPVAP